MLLPLFLWSIPCDSFSTIPTEGFSFLVDPFVPPVHTDDVHAHRAILVAMAVASVSGHFSSSRLYAFSLPHCFSPRRLISAPRTTRWRCPQTRTCWVWGSRLWGAPAPCPTTATCSSRRAAGPAPPAWPRGLRPTTRPSQVQSCDRRGLGGSKRVNRRQQIAFGS